MYTPLWLTLLSDGLIIFILVIILKGLWFKFQSDNESQAKMLNILLVSMGLSLIINIILNHFDIFPLWDTLIKINSILYGLWFLIYLVVRIFIIKKYFWIVKPISILLLVSILILILSIFVLI